MIFVTDDGKGEKVALRLTSKVTDSDGKHQVIVVTGEDGDDKNDKKRKVIQGIQLSGVHKAKIDEALKKLEAALEKLPKQIDADTRKQLEDLRKTLRSMKDDGQGAAWKLADDQGKFRFQLQEDTKRAGEEAKRHSEEVKRHAEVRMKLAQEYAAKAKEQATVIERKAREQALAAEKQAKAAQEKALARWKEAKDGKGKDDAIRDLEKAIAEKEKALADLKSSETRKRLDKLESFRSPAPSSKGRLGVVVGDIDSNLRAHLDLGENQGLMINEVIDSSPAWNNGNGIKSSDILVELAGRNVPSNHDQFREMVSKLGEGTYNAVVIRKGKKLTINGIKLSAAEKASKVTLAPASLDKLDRVTQVSDVALNKVARLTELKSDDQAKHNVIVDLINPAQLEQAKLAGRFAEIKPTIRTLPADVVATRSLAPMVTKVHALQQGAKPRLGLSLEEVPEVVAAQVELAENRGLYITEVVEDTPARKAGFQKNDILIEFADKPVTRDHADFSKSLREMKAGKYTATVIRKGKEIRIREINLPEVKTADQEKKDKLREWVVEDDKKAEMKEKEKAKDKLAGRDKKKEKDDFFPNAGRGVQRNGGNTTVMLNNDQFTAKSTNEGKTITVTGRLTGGNAQPTSITIKTDDEEKKFKSLKDVPANDKAEVERLLGSFRGGVFQFGGGNFQFGGNGFRFNNGAFDKQFQEHMKLLEKQLELFGQGNPGFEQMQKQMRQFERNRNDKDDDFEQ
jgi:hypothetical protein